MEEWSGIAELGDETTEIEHGRSCRNGHRDTVIPQTSRGNSICLLCFSKLLADENALLIHRTYAVDEFSIALTDEVFCRELLDRHPSLLVAPLTSAISLSSDEAFCKAIVDVVLRLCRLSGSDHGSLLEAFIRQVAKQVGHSSLWSPRKRYTLHVMGLLLEIHSMQELCVPKAIRSHKDFVPNLLDSLQLPGEELRGESLYVLFKIASYEDSAAELLRYAPKLCYVAVQALLKSESDALRINCIALLSVMARRSIFNITLRAWNSSGVDQTMISNKENTRTENSTGLVKTFAEAIKGALLSSDLQVQTSALQLMCLLFPDGDDLDQAKQVLVEEGIVEYVFETLRLSGRQERIQALAVDVLSLLSAAEHPFAQRIRFGIETLIRILKESVETPCHALQMKALGLLSQSLLSQPGILSVTRAEELLEVLAKILNYLFKMVQEEEIVDHSNVAPCAFNSACIALTCIAEAPYSANISNVQTILQTAAASSVLTAETYAKLNFNPGSLKYSACLLQAVFQLSLQLSALDGGAMSEIKALSDLCELHLLPAFKDQVDNLDDETIPMAVNQTFTLFLKSDNPESHLLASRLMEHHCFSFCFELMARFPTRDFQDCAYILLSATVDKLTGYNFDKFISDLPGDPAKLLALLEAKTGGDQRLISVHHAIIVILSVSYSFEDRLANDGDIMAALEQHLLVNYGQTLTCHLPPNEILKHLLSTYITAKSSLANWDAPSSAEAENLLERTLRICDCNDLLRSETPKCVLGWFLQKASLQDLAREQLLQWFTSLDPESNGANSQNLYSGIFTKLEPGSQHFQKLGEVLGTEHCGIGVLMNLLDKLVMGGVDDGVRIVTSTLIKLVRINVVIGYQLIREGILSNLRQMIHTYDVKGSDSTISLCLELVFQLLYDSETHLETMMVDKLWMDITLQCVSLIIKNVTSRRYTFVLAPLSVVNLILHKSYIYNSFAQECKVIIQNRDLNAKLDESILEATSHKAKLTNVELTSVDGELLVAALLNFNLRLRCASRFQDCHKEYSICLQIAWCGANDPMKRWTCLDIAHLCRVLYFGPPTLKILACLCIAEIFSLLPDVMKEDDSTKYPENDLPTSLFTSLTMVLQGCIMAEDEKLQANGSWCLYRLLCSGAVSFQQKQAVAGSPWNYILLQNIVSSLSTRVLRGDSRNATKSLGHNFSAAYAAMGLLKMCRSQSYLSHFFSPTSISDIIANLSDDNICPVTVAFFDELLNAKFLRIDHVRNLRDLFQETRRKKYERGSLFHSVDSHTSIENIYGKLSNFSFSSRPVVLFAMQELVIASQNKWPENIAKEDFSSRLSQTDSRNVISLIDKFMEDSRKLLA